MSGGDEKPVAWMRRWAFEGEQPFKIRSERTGRMKTHPKFGWLEVTRGKILPDDVPLFARESAQ